MAPALTASQIVIRRERIQAATDASTNRASSSRTTVARAVSSDTAIAKSRFGRLAVEDVLLRISASAK
jgi:hypothetical protein